MSVNARNEEYEHIELLGKPALLTDSRIDRDTVPKGWHCYDLRGSDYDPGKPITVENWVVVNHAGTVLMPDDLKLDAVKDRRRRIGDKLNYLDETLTLEQFCEEHGIPYPEDTRKYTLRPASEEEAGLFYAMPEERDRLLGAIGHVRFDFGNSGEQFCHTWWPRGPEELNSPEFKNELTDVVNELREGMLKSLENMKRYCINHGGALVLGTYPSYGYTIETESYVYRLRCVPVRGDYNGYLSCFDKRAFESNLAEKRKELAELNEQVAPFVLSVDDYGDYRVGSDEPFSYFGVDNGTALEKVFKKAVKEIPHSEQIIYESNDETFCAYSERFEDIKACAEKMKELCDDPEQLAQTVKEALTIVGIVTYGEGAKIEFNDADEYLETVKSELPFADMTGFHYETISDDPELRSAIDKEVYNLFGEECPRQTESNNNTMTMGGI